MNQNLYLLDGGHLIASASRSAPTADWLWTRFAALIPDCLIQQIETLALVSESGAVGEYRFEMEGGR